MSDFYWTNSCVAIKKSIFLSHFFNHKKEQILPTFLSQKMFQKSKTIIYVNVLSELYFINDSYSYFKIKFIEVTLVNDVI